MGKLCHGATHRIRVRALDNLVQFGQAQTADDRLMRLRGRNEASIILNSNLTLLTASFVFALRGITPHSPSKQNSVNARSITYPQLVYHEGAPIPSDLSCEAGRRKLRAQRYAGWSNRALSCARLAHPLPA